MLPVNFTPGPSQIYFTVEDHIRQGFREGIPSISHRSKTFEQIYKTAKEGIFGLLNVPADWEMVFTSSATEIWERSLENLVTERSHHFVNGSFSKRFYEFAGLLGKDAGITLAPEGQGFELVTNSLDAELIAITQNETSTGVSVQNDWIAEIRKHNPEALLIVDGVSSLPHLQPDFSQVDSVFFSVQKGFGMPAGLGVWLVNQRCADKAEQRTRAGLRTGTYHALPSLLSNAKKFQTPSTPNVLGIYVLSKVCEDLLRRGIDTIRKETNYKASLLYHTLDQHQTIKPFVAETKHRSPTVVVAKTDGRTKEIAEVLLKNGLQAGDGYGPGKQTQLRFANFPAHSKEVYEQLCDLLAKLD